MLKVIHHLFLSLFLLFSSLYLSGCAEGGTTILSSGYNVSGTLPLLNSLWEDTYWSGLSLNAASVTEFKFCIGRIKLEADDDQAQGGDGDGEIVFEPGLIDVSTGAQKTWGSVEIPTGFTLKRVKLKVKTKAELCGVDYSVRFDGVETTSDIEILWENSSPVGFRKGQKIRIQLQDFVNALLVHEDGSTLTPENLKSTLESIQEDFELLNE